MTEVQGTELIDLISIVNEKLDLILIMGEKLDLLNCSIYVFMGFLFAAFSILIMTMYFSK